MYGEKEWMMKKLTVLLVGIFIFSCDKPHEVTLPPHVPKLVVHAYAEPGKTFEIFVSRSVSKQGIIPDDSALIVKNAIILLYENDVFRDTLAYDPADRKYIGLTDTAYEGKVYRIVVQASGFATAEATASTAPFIHTTSVSYTRKARADASGLSLDDITVRFNDPDSQENYYLLQLHAPEPYNSRHLICVYTYDPVVEESQGVLDAFESSNCIPNGEVVFSDNLFNGLSKEITISADSYILEEIVARNMTYRPFVKKFTISKEFCRYIKGGSTQDILRNNPFTQPFTVQGNVKNGYGMFAIASQVTDTLR